MGHGYDARFARFCTIGVGCVCEGARVSTLDRVDKNIGQERATPRGQEGE